jgi:poly(A) polymerase
VIKDFFTYLELEKWYSKHTITAYRNDLEQFIAFLSLQYEGVSLEKVTHHQIRSWMVDMTEKGMSNRTIRRKIASLNTFYKFLERKKTILKNPVAKIIIPKMSTDLPSFIRDNELDMLLNNMDFGQLIDPFGGIRDLDLKIIRTPLDPDITYSDDPLRMMRAIRFASQLNFKIEEKSLKAITKNSERIKIVSQERITDELNKIIMAAKPSVGFKLLNETGLLKIIFPEMVELQGAEYKEGRGHKDNFLHTLIVLDNIALKTKNLWLRWAAILHDIGKPATKKWVDGIGWTFHGHDFVGSKMIPSIFRRMKLPKGDHLKYVQKLVALHLRPIALVEDVVSDSAVRRLLFEAGNDIDDLMTLCSADMSSKIPEKIQRYRENFDLVRTKLIEIEEKDRLRNWQPPITGDIIMTTFNIPPCKEVGIIKTAIREAILEGNIPNEFEPAYQLMLQTGKELGLKQVSN